mmetsp:Transcript_28133/g.42565  ORF Transcript_28133/g.42565 Transcript_28133/m.42565 type:complete len:287 (+) Transcript_28133:46-906(+)
MTTMISKMSSSPWTCFSWLIFALTLKLNMVASYPLISETAPSAGQQVQCFQYSIPPEDDANMVFLAIPEEISQSVEPFFVDQIVQMNKNRKHASEPLPRTFPMRWEDEPDISPLIRDFIVRYTKNSRTRTMLKITKPGTPRPLRQQEFSFFRPIVLNNVEKYQRSRGENSDGYMVCFENNSDKIVHVYFELILMSQHEKDDKDPGMMTKDHLSPLESDLAATIDAASSILSEMKYLAKREERMLMTTNSINGRVRLYSYISVGVLLLATYLQVTYLKGYFKKKKLM